VVFSNEVCSTFTAMSSRTLLPVHVEYERIDRETSMFSTKIPVAVGIVTEFPVTTDVD